MGKIDSVDEYIENAPGWQDGLRQLRQILLAAVFDEAIKWGSPCYTKDGKNVVGLGAFKSYFGLWFFQGALLPDPQNVLINAQEGKTKALRQWRFTDEIIDTEAVASYLEAAIEIHDRGDLIMPDRGRPVSIPPELGEAFTADPAAKAAFDQLTLGKRREYADHVVEAKRADTKDRRIDKIIPMIRAGLGLHDKYR
ncbi:MAG: hypothetical protein GY906_15325 [bacterium]|nr:hypothetical protein [bacterium]